MEGYESLQAQLNLNEGIPYTPNWTAGADFLQIIVDDCLQAKPSLVLECSSGLTSLMLARCCQING
ncbi:MAG: class I SAM-dependent methyltransferase, partial [Pseudomonadota bacterium]